MEKPLILDDVKIHKPNHNDSRPHEKVPPRYGTVAGGVKKWQYDPQHFTFGHGQKLATLSNEIVLLLQLNDGSTVLDYSAIATSEGWRADIFVTAFLQVGGASIAQYPLPVVQCFCGN